MTTTEAEWDDDERAWATSLLDLEADTCGGCGQPLSESTRPEAYGGYEAGLPVACQGCRALAARQKDHAEDKHLHALRFPVRRTWRDDDEPGGWAMPSP